MPYFHQTLINLHKKLNYFESPKGVCALYSEKGIDAWLGGDSNYKQFEQRKKFIQDQIHLPEQIKNLHLAIKKNRLLISKYCSPEK